MNVSRQKYSAKMIKNKLNNTSRTKYHTINCQSDMSAHALIGLYRPTRL